MKLAIMQAVLAVTLMANNPTHLIWANEENLICGDMMMD
jgi:hypothetical protein